MSLELYDREGNPMSMEDWARRLQDRAYARVADDPVGGVRVSTVWLGLDHGWGEGPPLIFETMVFGLPGDDLPQWRYSTEAEARAGHEAAVRWVHDGCPPEEEP